MTSARGLSARAADHPAIETGVRAGQVANGVVNLVIGWIALQLAWGGGGEASTSGALDTIAATPVGTVLLVVVIAGFALLGLWYLTGVLLETETKDRLVAAARGVTYLVLGGLALSVLLRSGAGSEGESEQAAGLTATVMSQPFGRVLVGVVGLGVVALGVRHTIKGVKQKFLEDLARRPPRWAVHAGRVGYVARGATFLLIGGFVVTAAVQEDPEEARGLDGALQSLLELPLGAWLLTVTALGFVAYGVYCAARARYTEI